MAARKSLSPKNVSVGFISRGDFLSLGFRKWLFDVASEVFHRASDVKFIVYVGGLISFGDYKRILSERIAEAMQERVMISQAQKTKPKEERVAVESLQDIRLRVAEELMQETVEKLAQYIPAFIDKEGNPLKLYIVTAPAINYDGKVGAQIAGRLSRIRSDIIFWGSKDKRLRLKGFFRADGKERNFWVVLPTKAAWRSKYFSTRPDRLIEDIESQTTQTWKDPTDLWVSDCSAVSLITPRGANKTPRISTPGLHRLQETTTSENQIGVAIVEFSPDGDEMAIATEFWSFKDFVAQERTLISAPEGASDLQAKIFRAVAEYPRTVGMLEDVLGSRRELIEKAIAQYQEKALQPAIVCDESQEYNFDSLWLQHAHLQHPIAWDQLRVDSILGFGCLHAGYEMTQYDYFVHTVPELILRYGVTTLVGAGDYIAGLKHNLHLRGEIIGGMNYTQQQDTAAWLKALVILKVFRARFEQTLKKNKDKIGDPDFIRAVVNDALLRYLFWLGNHDKWLLDFGVDPIDTVISHLYLYLTQELQEYLRSQGFFVEDIADIVRSHIVYADEHVLPSGIRMGINHPEMARAGTTSLRTQETLGARPDCQAVVLANFHIGKEVCQWEGDLGQRVGLQVGTLVSGTDFEDGKNKRVDTGVGMLRICSLDGRILSTKTTFEGPRKGELKRYSSSDIFAAFRKSLGGWRNSSEESS